MNILCIQPSHKFTGFQDFKMRSHECVGVLEEYKCPFTLGLELRAQTYNIREFGTWELTSFHHKAQSIKSFTNLEAFNILSTCKVAMLKERY